MRHDFLGAVHLSAIPALAVSLCHRLSSLPTWPLRGQQLFFTPAQHLGPGWVNRRDEAVERAAQHDCSQRQTPPVLRGTPWPRHTDRGGRACHPCPNYAIDPGLPRAPPATERACQAGNGSRPDWTSAPAHLPTWHRPIGRCSMKSENSGFWSATCASNGS